MDQPALDKLILAKLMLPLDAQREIKKFLQVPTPTARLMQRVIVTHHGNRSIIEGPDLRNYEQRGRWSNPPLLPKILISHNYRNESDLTEGDYSDHDPYDQLCNPLRSQGWDSAGEPLGGRGYKGFVKLFWPPWTPGEEPEWHHYTPAGIVAMLG